MKTAIKNLIIDLGVVLLDLSPARCFENFKKIGVNNINEMVDSHYKDGLFLELEKGLVSPEKFYDELRNITSLPITNAQIDEAWNSFLLNIPTYKLDLLLELNKNYNVYLLSNTNAIHWKQVIRDDFSYKGLKAEDYFKKLYLSFELNLVKPDRRIFEHVLSDANIRPEETFFIDDAVENCRIAHSMGIETYMPKPEEDWSHIFTK